MRDGEIKKAGLSAHRDFQPLPYLSTQFSGSLRLFIRGIIAPSQPSFGPFGKPIGGIGDQSLSLLDLRKIGQPGEELQAFDPLRDGIEAVSRAEVHILHLITGNHGGRPLLDEESGSGLVDFGSLREVVEPT